MEALQLKLKVQNLVKYFNEKQPAEWHAAIKSLGKPFDGEKNVLRRKAYDMLCNSIEKGCWFIVFTQELVDKHHLVLEGSKGKAVFYPKDLGPCTKFCS